MSNKPECLIVMGVCGVGKTAVARLLSNELPAIYIEADDFHPSENVEAMRAGIPLTDEMRLPWLTAIAEEILSARQEHPGCHVAVACSALKRSYRDVLRDCLKDVRFVHLAGEKELIRTRLLSRSDHFMSPDLLNSQWETLESPDNSECHLKIGIEGSCSEIVADILTRLQEKNGAASIRQ